MEFVVEYSLAECCDRLQQTASLRPKFALFYKEETHIKLEMIGADRTKVYLKQREDPSLINWGSVADVAATLEHLAPQSTHITAEIRLNWPIIIFSQILWVLSSVVMLLSWAGSYSASTMGLLILGAVVVNLLGFAFLWILAQDQGQKLVNILKEKLN